MQKQNPERKRRSYSAVQATSLALRVLFERAFVEVLNIIFLFSRNYVFAL